MLTGITIALAMAILFLQHHMRRTSYRNAVSVSLCTATWGSSACAQTNS